MRSIGRAVALGLAEKIPLVSFADINNDGQLQLVFGPRNDGMFGKFLRELPNYEISVWRLAFVLGVR